MIVPAPSACWVEVDLDAVRANAGHARRVAGVAVMAVVKADGYGHGAVRVARAALEGGATWLAVARAEEALALRAAGIDAPLLLLGYAPPAALGDLVAAGVSLTVWSVEQVAQLAAVRAGRTAGVHLKVDTGMSRLGTEPGAVVEVARAVRAAAYGGGGGPHVVLDGVFTHFACADDPVGEVTAAQVARFEEALAALGAAGLRPPLVHAANSAATLLGLPAGPGRAARPLGYDLVRFGIALYGLQPGPDVPMAGLRPALSWKSVLAQVKTVPAGSGVSYGHTYRTDHPQRIGTVPVGYADGWRRGAPNEVLVRGVRARVLGRVCMDQCMVDLDGVPDAAVGEEVVLIGAQTGPDGVRTITADDVAARWGTIGYEVVCGIGRRVPRHYVESSA